MAGEATSGQQINHKALAVENDVVSTTYSHTNYIDVETGSYDVDCNGFVGFVLDEAAPEHLHQIRPEPGYRWPRAYIYQRYFADLAAGGAGTWIQVLRLADARPGDIIAWSLIEEPDLDQNTGHVMIVAEEPIDLGGATLSVRVYDSSDVIHFDDSRGQGGDSPATGIGIGTIHFRVGADGSPIDFKFGPGDPHFATDFHRQDSTARGVDRRGGEQRAGGHVFKSTFRGPSPPGFS